MAGAPDGFLVLARKLFASDLWNRPEPFDSRSAFIDLLRRASYAPRPFRTQGREILLQPGEFVLDAGKLGRRWGWSRSKVHRLLRQLRDRGTLTVRPAWSQETTTKRVPYIYAFPNWEIHQKPWTMKPVSPTQGKAPDQLNLSSVTPAEKQTPVTPEKKIKVDGDTGTRHRKDAQKQRKKSEPVTPERDTGLIESDTGVSQPKQSPANLDDSLRHILQKSKPRDAGTEYNLSKESNIPYLSYQPGDTFHAVQELAAYADAVAWGNGDNPHRGLNVQILLKAVQGGTDPETLGHIIRGTRLLADAGRVPWIQPGTPFCLTAIFGEQRHLEDQALSSAAYTASTQENDP